MNCKSTTDYQPAGPSFSEATADYYQVQKLFRVLKETLAKYPKAELKEGELAVPVLTLLKAVNNHMQELCLADGHEQGGAYREDVTSTATDK